ncbi:CAMK/CAMK1 protein kinase [Allomyces macrogynus ATCC 38327]|uniref:CAMK/CAMK1 protein kinase n=1 Tax=Allomyces macrogynus (strain ATCC 38327) TaxID=578462 RepID=A0A0L0SAR9_ALLM3|nr:CAMK/CAMK1 protein kinase [Allomyces macrogynus ATCC 38327]|eukprot:KNE59527.1 CAMK/CAMK1 protein kinase [Allomyces macrogynus ATCC 38327]
MDLVRNLTAKWRKKAGRRASLSRSPRRKSNGGDHHTDAETASPRDDDAGDDDAVATDRARRRRSDLDFSSDPADPSAVTDSSPSSRAPATSRLSEQFGRLLSGGSTSRGSPGKFRDPAKAGTVVPVASSSAPDTDCPSSSSSTSAASSPPTHDASDAMLGRSHLHSGTSVSAPRSRTGAGVRGLRFADEQPTAVGLAPTSDAAIGATGGAPAGLPDFYDPDDPTLYAAAAYDEAAATAAATADRGRVARIHVDDDDNEDDDDDDAFAHPVSSMDLSDDEDAAAVHAQTTHHGHHHVHFSASTPASANVSPVVAGTRGTAAAAARHARRATGVMPLPAAYGRDPSLPVYLGLEEYELVKKMGEGAFSHVYQGVDLTTEERVAIKVIDKVHLSVSQRSSIQKELIIHSRLAHPNITRLLRHFETPECYFFVLELSPGGEVFHKIVELTFFSEALSRHVIVQVARAVKYLHQVVGVVHRDIKPENLLFTPIPFDGSVRVRSGRTYGETKLDEGEFIPGVGGGGIGQVKLADFGLSKVVWQDGTKTPCGTVGYTAPEIVTSQSYTTSVDIWALGCVLYTMLCGFPPFYDEDTQVLTHKVARGEWTFLAPWWDNVSESAKDLVSRLLEVRPERRYTIDDFFAHPWINEAPFVTPHVEAEDPFPDTSYHRQAEPLTSPVAYTHERHPAQSAPTIAIEPPETETETEPAAEPEAAAAATFDWGAFVIPPLKTPATDRPPSPFGAPLSPMAAPETDGFTRVAQAMATPTPSQNAFRHYFDTSIKAFEAMDAPARPAAAAAEGEDDDDTSPAGAADDAAKQQQRYKDLGYMRPGFLTPAAVVRQTYGMPDDSAAAVHVPPTVDEVTETAFQLAQMQQHHPRASAGARRVRGRGDGDRTGDDDSPGHATSAVGGGGGGGGPGGFALKLGESSIFNKRRAAKPARAGAPGGGAATAAEGTTRPKVAFAGASPGDDEADTPGAESAATGLGRRGGAVRMHSPPRASPEQGE